MLRHQLGGSGGRPLLLEGRRPIPEASNILGERLLHFQLNRNRVRISVLPGFQVGIQDFFDSMKLSTSEFAHVIVRERELLVHHGRLKIDSDTFVSVNLIHLLSKLVKLK